MFKGNGLVLILPLLLMGFIFFGGYYYLNGANQMTNEELNQVIALDAEATASGEVYIIRGKWDWKEMPSDGLIGDDYIGIALLNGQTLEVDQVKNTELTLMHGGKTVYETEGSILPDGIVFSFPNLIKEHESMGNVGTFQITIDNENLAGSELSIGYLHTWEEHSRFTLNSARLSSDMVDANHWIIERFIKLD